jgi:hypothetical protein
LFNQSLPLGDGFGRGLERIDDCFPLSGERLRQLPSRVKSSARQPPLGQRVLSVDRQLQIGESDGQNLGPSIANEWMVSRDGEGVAGWIMG